MSTLTGHRLTHFSYSQHTSYLKCPKSYELERVSRYPRRPAWWFIGGRLVHEVTETFDLTFLQSGQFVRLASDELTKKLDTLVQEEVAKSGTSPEKWFAAGPVGHKQNYEWWKENLPAIYGRYVDWRTETQWPIAQFGGRAAVELSLRFFLGSLEMVGAPDRVFIYPSGELVVADIKTGATIPKEPLQLGEYATGLELLGYPRPKWGTYILLKDGTVTPPVPLDKYDARYLSAIHGAVADNIQRGSFPPAVGDQCRQCVVQDACYAVSGSQSAFWDPLDPNYQKGTDDGLYPAHPGNPHRDAPGL